jgi:hypothetical protein
VIRNQKHSITTNVQTHKRKKSYLKWVEIHRQRTKEPWPLKGLTKKRSADGVEGYLFGEFERVKMKGRLCFWINLFIFLIFICPKFGFQLFFRHLAKKLFLS